MSEDYENRPDNRTRGYSEEDWVRWAAMGLSVEIDKEKGAVFRCKHYANCAKEHGVRWEHEGANCYDGKGLLAVDDDDLCDDGVTIHVGRQEIENYRKSKKSSDRK